MRQPNASAALRVIVATCLTLALPAGLVAQIGPGHLLTPNGNPTGAASATSTQQFDGQSYQVSLNPNQIGTAFLLPPAPDGVPPISLQQILNASLEVQGSAWQVTSEFGVQGNLRLDQYYAFAGSRPAIQQGSLNVPGVNAPGDKTTYGIGGAVLALHYMPSGTDPANVRWLQLVRTNDPIGTETTWTHPYDSPGYVWFIDNDNNASPFYDSVFAANGTDFVDAPARFYNGTTRWRGYLFLAIDDPINQTISVCGAAYWGFDEPVIPVPEPGALILAFIGAIPVVVHCRRGRVPRNGLTLTSRSKEPTNASDSLR
jgi:hypothetical protein